MHGANKMSGYRELYAAPEPRVWSDNAESKARQDPCRPDEATLTSQITAAEPTVSFALSFQRMSRNAAEL